MARYGWKDISNIFVAGYDVQVMKALEVEIPKIGAVIEELAPAGEEWTEKADTGIRKTDGAVVLFVPLDDTTDGSEDAFVTAAHLTDAVVTIGVQGNVLGRRVYSCSSHQIDYGHEPEREGVTKLRINFDPDGELYQLKIVVPKQTVTAGGDSESTPLDNGASSANGGVAVLQAADVDLDGGDDLDVRMRHSADNVTYGDLVAFDVVTGARDGQIKAVAGTVNRYLAASWVYNGTPGGGETATILVAFKRS